jgi:thiamine pyrophosphokinase
MKNNNTKMKTKSDMKILSETNTSRSVNNPTPHIDMNENQSEFPNDDYIFNNIDLDNVVQTIENFKYNIGETNVKINSGNSSRFSILPYASIGNVTINIYGSEK